MAGLVVLLGGLSYIMLLAVLNGTLGYLCSMGVTTLGAVGAAKLLPGGQSIALSYGWIAALAVLLGVMRGFLRYVEQYANHYIAFRLLAVLRDKIFKALRVLCPAKLETKQKGGIIAMITSDIETLEVFYAHTVSPIGIALLVSTGVLAFAGIFAGWAMAAAALVGYLLIGVILPLISSRALKKPGVVYRREFSAFNAFFLDSIKGVREIVLYNAGGARVKEVNARSDRLLQETKKINDRAGLANSCSQLLISLTIVGVLGLAAALVVNGSLPASRAVIALAAVFASFGPVAALSALPSNLTQTLAAGDRALDILAEKPEVLPVTDGEDFAFEELCVRGLCFGYAKGGRVLDGAALSAKKGEIVGIVGESGCGKSTLLKLMLRFWQKEAGEIRYNGPDVDAVRTKSLLKNVTMVSQSTYLFDDTVEENLRIAKRDATAEELEAACKKASIHEFIRSLPDGYRTRVGLLGERLSAGERQRIGLARAFLHDGPLILLDEPTSNVDSINEGMILRALKRHKEKKCIILVSHRESTMAIADRSYRMEKGRVVERGVSHAE
jgi:ATP-binding cassette subfamily C protein